MWLAGKAVVHIIDSPTTFTAPIFLDSKVEICGQSVQCKRFHDVFTRFFYLKKV